MTRTKSHSDQAIDLANKRVYARRYYQANKARSRVYYLANREKIKARAKAWRLDHPEEYLNQQRYYDRFKRDQNKAAKQALNKVYSAFASPSPDK